MKLSHTHSAHASAIPKTPAGHGPLSPHTRLQKEVQKWVAQTFFGAMLKQMHEGPFHSKLLDGGRGGQAFAGLYDQRLAEHMAQAAAGHRLVNSIVSKIERSKEARAAYAKTARGAPGRVGAGIPSTEGKHHVPPARRA